MLQNLETLFHSKIEPRLIRKFCYNIRLSKDHFLTFRVSLLQKWIEIRKYICEIANKIKTILRVEPPDSFPLLLVYLCLREPPPSVQATR